jgi:hypothetical protein
MCWYEGFMKKSLNHFSKAGFNTMAAVYYDNHSTANITNWLKQLRRTPNACGTMYTTWTGDYSFLKEYGEMVNNGEGTPAQRH